MAIGFPVKADYATGDVLTAANMNDLSGSVNLLESAQYAAGKNKIINSNFGVWQRGTTFNSATNGNFFADRWTVGRDGTNTVNITQQTFTPGTAPVSGYEGQFFARASIASTGTLSFLQFTQAIEDVRTLAGQTITISFWAKGSATATGLIYIEQNFGSGGSASVETGYPTFSLTTSWTRFSVNITVPSISGKTVGTSSLLRIFIRSGLTANSSTFDLWGVQVEAGSVASDFQTATGTIQGELAACQRYYWRPSGQSNYAYYAGGVAEGGTVASILLPTPVNLRSPSTASVDYSTLAVGDASGTLRTVTSLIINHYQSNCVQLLAYVASGLTQYRPAFLLNNNSTSAYVAISSEL
jgi:hypothetical protein